MIGILVLILVLGTLINGVWEYNSSKKVNIMSFKEAMELVELPVITFYNGDKKLNFLLDTGSNISYINSSLAPDLNYTISKKLKTNVIGVEGNKVESQFCEMIIKYKNQEFKENFAIKDLNAAFDIVKQESGVQIHGILGSMFFQNYRYILDFDTLIAYSNV